MNFIKNAKNVLFSVVFIGIISQASAQKAPGIIISNMDLSANPKDDFYQFVNGGWLKNTQIPADKTRWGTYDELRQKTDLDALGILKEAANDPKYKSNSDQGKAINLYKSILDTVSRNKQGLSPLKPYLAKIDAVRNVKDLQALFSEMEPTIGIGFFGAGISADAKNSNRNVIYISPGGLGLPDRDYYVSDDKDSKEKREKYVLHVARMLQFLGTKPKKAQADAEKILAFETAMSKPRLDRVERRDERKSYNPMTVSDLQKLTPSIDWNSYLTNIGLKKVDSLVVTQPKYMIALESILKEKKVEDWKAYMRWTLLNNSASKLSLNVEVANWEFYGKTLTGALKQRPREEMALQVINGSIGEALGKLYVEKRFPPEAKAKAVKMIKYIFIAFENRINNLPWMTAETKKIAIGKLHKITPKIGYPDKWIDYSALTINSAEEGGTYFENRININRWGFQRDLDNLNKPVDKSEWFVAPQIVNAFYSPSYNQITFPAGVLQPPFYNYQADDAINYGSIGCTIGHEVSHAFDDSGARYDADGNLKNWWTDEDLKQFTALTGALADQFSAIEPLPGMHIDGKFTLGENIGDLGGVNVSFDGLQLDLKENGRPDLIDGYTPEQRFYISWTTKWRSQIREEALKNQLKTDPHSPGKYRAFVPLKNVDAFYKAYDIKPGDGMYVAPEKRVKIW